MIPLFLGLHLQTSSVCLARGHGNLMADGLQSSSRRAGFPSRHSISTRRHWGRRRGRSKTTAPGAAGHARTQIVSSSALAQRSQTPQQTGHLSPSPSPSNPAPAPAPAKQRVVAVAYSPRRLSANCQPARRWAETLTRWPTVAAQRPYPPFLRTHHPNRVRRRLSDRVGARPRLSVETPRPAVGSEQVLPSAPSVADQCQWPCRASRTTAQVTRPRPVVGRAPGGSDRGLLPASASAISTNSL